MIGQQKLITGELFAMKSAMLLVLATAACAAAATEEKLSQRFNVEAGGAVIPVAV